MPIVFVWNNNFISAKLQPSDPARQHSYVGHSSMQIRPEFNLGLAIIPAAHPLYNIDNGHFKTWYKEDPNFVSWMPGFQEGGHRMKRSTQYHRSGNMVPNFFFDLVVEGYAPDHIINIRATQAQIDRMVAMRRTIESKYSADNRNPSYRMYRKNCSTIVARVLGAAYRGAHFNFKSFIHKTVPWTPLEIKRVCQRLPNSRAYTWDEFLERLKNNQYIHINTWIVLKEFMRRSSTHGSSGAIPRHLYEEGSKKSLRHRRKISSREANTTDFIAQQAYVDLGNTVRTRNAWKDAVYMSNAASEGGTGLLPPQHPVRAANFR